MTAKSSNGFKAPQRVLVTGGGGFLGSAIVKRLLAAGHNVRSFSRSAYPHLGQWGVEQVQGDLKAYELVKKACVDIDLVFHTAAKPPPWGAYRDYYQTNVGGTRNVIAACQSQQVPCLIHTSTPSVIFDGRDLQGVNESVPYPSKYLAYYPQTKALAEQSVCNSINDCFRAVILRPHQIWGPGDPHFVPRLIKRAKKLKRIGDGKNFVDTTYIDNAADAHLLAADKLLQNPQLSGRIYFISQDEPLPAWDIINAILQAAGLDTVKGSMPYRTADRIGAILEFAYRFFKLSGEPQMTRFLAFALAKSHWFDISAAKQDLGYQPAVSTREGLERLTGYLQPDESGHSG